MTDKTTTSLTAATVAAATDLFYAVIGGNSRKIALSGTFNFGAVALGGATIGTHKLAVTGTVDISGQITGPVGAVEVPSYSFVGATTYGMYFNAASGVVLVHGGADVLGTRTGGFSLPAANFLAWTDGAINGTSDLFLYRDAANTLAQRNGTAAQVANYYDTYTSATDFHRIAIKTARATLSGVTGASVTATGIIPDGAVLVGVTTKVTTGLGVTNGTTGYQVGTGADPDRWGAITGTAAGTSSDNTNWTAGTIEAFTAASDIILTAVGGNFDGTGVIYVSVQYLIGQCD